MAALKWPGVPEDSVFLIRFFHEGLKALIMLK